MDGSGQVQWSTYVAQTWGVGAYDLALDKEGNVLGLIGERGTGVMLLDGASGQPQWYARDEDFPVPGDLLALSLDAEGNLYLAGKTSEEEFPQRTNEYRGGRTDAFVVHVTPPDGTTLPSSRP